jgi:hypothetical protein
MYLNLFNRLIKELKMKKNNNLKIYFSICILFVLSSCNQPTQKTLSDADIQLLNQATGLMGQYQYQAAVEILAPIHQKLPSNATITLDLAVAILNRQEDGDIETAIQLAKQVDLQDANNPRANYILGILYLYQGQAKQALKPLQQVVLAEPDDAYAEYFYAQSLEQLGDFQGAYLHYSKSAELLPYLRSASYAAAMTARKLGNKQQAKIHLEAYQQLKNNPRALLAEYKYTRMGKLAEFSTDLAKTKLPTKKTLLATIQPVQWQNQTVMEALQVNHLAVIQKLNNNLTTELLFSKSDQDLSNKNRLPDFQLRTFPLTDIQQSAVADINNDGLTDVVVCSSGEWHLYLQSELKTWQPLKIFPESDKTRHHQCDAIKLFDADHDGDVDIFIANYQGQDELFSNNGNLTFRRLSDKWLSENSSKTLQVIALDWDHDRDLDILLLKQNGQLELLNNQLLWNYQSQPLAITNPIPFSKVLALDNNSDGKLELLTLDKHRVQLWTQNKDANWQSEVITQNTAGFENFLLEDFDGDGIQELVLYGTKGVLWHSFKQQSIDQQLTKQPIQQLRVIASPMAKGPILLSLEGPSEKMQLRTYFDSSNQTEYVYLQLRGAEDVSNSLRSNYQAIGSEVRGRVGSDWIIPATFSANSQNGQDLVPKILSTLGTGKLDFVEIRWPDGVFQTELNLAAGAIQIVETQRQLSSCPVLFVETQNGYQFVSDILGVGGVGFFAEPGKYVEPRPWEYFMLPKHMIKSGSNNIRLKITEPMEENTYLDSIQMHRYRLPLGWEMIIDERMGVSEPLPTGKPLFYKNSYQPLKVEDSFGNDVSEFLKTVDNKPAPIGKLHPQYIGLVEKSQQLIMYFPQIEQQRLATKQLGLVINGWVEYPYSQTVFAAWQADLSYQAPTIDVLVNNQWQTLHQQLGYPAGMPRKAYFPLQGLPKDTTAIRITTNLELYFDAIKLVEIETPPAMAKETAKIAHAKMEYIGFPQRTNAASNRPVYNYQNRTAYADMKTLTGDFTRYGEISELLLKEDNAFAIIGSGDSVAVEFEFNSDQSKTAQLTAANEYYVLEARGYAKDMDLYTDTGGTVTPIPKTQLTNFKTTTTAEKDHSKAASERLHDTYNTRYQDGW